MPARPHQGLEQPPYCDATFGSLPDLKGIRRRTTHAHRTEPLIHAARRSLRFRSPLPSFLRPSLLVTHTPDAHTVFVAPDCPLPFLPLPRSRKSFSAEWKPLR